MTKATNRNRPALGSQFVLGKSSPATGESGKGSHPATGTCLKIFPGLDPAYMTNALPFCSDICNKLPLATQNQGRYDAAGGTAITCKTPLVTQSLKEIMLCDSTQVRSSSPTPDSVPPPPLPIQLKAGRGAGGTAAAKGLRRRGT